MSAQSTEESLGDAARRIRAEKAAQAAQRPSATQTPAAPSAQAKTQTAVGAGDIWQALFDDAEAAMQQAEYVTAEELYRKSIQCAEQNSLAASTIAASYDGLGSALVAQRKYDDADAAYHTALQTWRKVDGDTDEQVARSEAGLGITLVGEQRYGEAEQLLLDSVHTYQQHPHASLCAQSIPLKGLAMLYRANHDYSKGERVYTDSFALLAGNHDTPCENFLSLLDNLAGLYADDNQWEKVEKVQQGAMGLALGMRGPRSEIYGDTIFALAQTMNKRRRFADAASTAAKAADIFRNTDPPATAKLAQTLQFEEFNLELAGKKEEAKQVYAAALAASDASRTGDPSDAMMSLRMRADEARRNGNIEQAARLTDEEVAAAQDLGAFYQIVALTDAAAIHEQQQKPADAEAELKRALELSIASTGPSSQSTAGAHVQLGSFYQRNKRLADAEESYQAALALFGPQDAQEVQRVSRLLGWTYVMDGKFDKAEPVYSRLLKMAEVSHDDAGTSIALTSVAVVYQKTNRNAEAEAALARSMSIAAQLPKPMNRLWASAAMTAAQFYEQTGQAPQAEQMYVQVIAFLEKESGANNPALRLPLEKLIASLKSRGQDAEAAKYQARVDQLPASPAMPGMAGTPR